MPGEICRSLKRSNFRCVLVQGVIVGLLSRYEICPVSRLKNIFTFFGAGSLAYYRQTGLMSKENAGLQKPAKSNSNIENKKTNLKYQKDINQVLTLIFFWIFEFFLKSCEEF